MGLFGGDKQKSSKKPTLLTQIGAGSTIGAFLPWGPGAIEGEQAGRAFAGGEYPTAGGMQDIGWGSTYAPYRRYTADYDPYSYLTNSPAGQGNPQGQQILQNSLYGTTAPLNMQGMQGANAAYQNFLASLYGGVGAPGGQGGYQQGGMDQSAYGPAAPQNWNLAQQPGRTWNPQTGQWQEVSSGADLTWDAGTNTTYYKGIPLTDADIQLGIKGGPQALEQALAQRQGPMMGGSQGLIGNLGKQALEAIGLGQMWNQQAPPPPDFDTGQYTLDFLNQLGQGGALDKYVQGATAGMRSEYEKTMADQIANLQSQYAAEGNYLSSPMFAAQGQLQGEMTSNYLRDMGLMQLDAANQERQRQFGLAGTVGPAQGDYLARTYGSYADTFQKLMSDTSSARASIINNAMQLMAQGYASNFEQAQQMALAQQGNEQAALDALMKQYYQPGENLLQVTSPLMGIAPKEKSSQSSGGLGGLGDLLGGVADIGKFAFPAGLF